MKKQESIKLQELKHNEDTKPMQLVYQNIFNKVQARRIVVQV